MQENRGSADITPIQDSTHTVRLRLRCAIALQPGPARTFTVRTLTSVDHYAEGMGNLRGRRSGGMQARTTHNQTTERNSMVTQASPRLTPGATVLCPLRGLFPVGQLHQPHLEQRLDHLERLENRL